MAKATKKEVLVLLARAETLLSLAENHLAEQGHPGIARLVGTAIGCAAGAGIVYKVAGLDSLTLTEGGQGNE